MTHDQQDHDPQPIDSHMARRLREEKGIEIFYTPTYCCGDPKVELRLPYRDFSRVDLSQPVSAFPAPRGVPLLVERKRPGWLNTLKWLIPLKALHIASRHSTATRKPKGA